MGTKIQRVHTTHFLPFELLDPLKEKRVIKPIYERIQKIQAGMNKVSKTGNKFIKATKVINFGVTCLITGCNIGEAISTPFTIPVPFKIIGVSLGIPSHVCKIIRSPCSLLQVVVLKNVFEVTEGACDFAKGLLAGFQFADTIMVLSKAGDLATRMGSTVPFLNILSSGLTIGSSTIKIFKAIYDTTKLYKPLVKAIKGRAFWKKGLTEENIDKRVKHLAKRYLQIEQKLAENQLTIWKARQLLLKEKPLRGNPVLMLQRSRANREVKVLTKIVNDPSKQEAHDQKVTDQLARLEFKQAKFEALKNLSIDDPKVQAFQKAHLNKHKWKIATISLTAGYNATMTLLHGTIIGVNLACIILLGTGYGGAIAPMILSGISGGGIVLELGLNALAFGQRRWLNPKGENQGYWKKVMGEDVADEVSDDEKSADTPTTRSLRSSDDDSSVESEDFTSVDTVTNTILLNNTTSS